MFKVGDVVRPIRPITRDMLSEVWIEDEGAGWLDDLIDELNRGHIPVTKAIESPLGKQYVLLLSWMLPADWFELEVT